MKKLNIDPELRDLLPPLTSDEYKQLEKNIVENGYDRNFPIMEWHGFIVDGHNRYNICEKHNIEFISGTLAYETKEEVMEWMLDIQLGRRNLSPIQRIAVTEKYRPIYEKQAKENLINAGKNYGIGKEEKPLVNLPNPIDTVNTSEKLASIAGVSEKTYRMGAKVLNSDNEDVKKRVISGETSISAGYKELNQKKQENENKNGESSNVTPTSVSFKYDDKPQISEEVKQICADLKTEKTKEYLDSNWHYQSNFVECMLGDAEMFYDTLKSHLDSLDGRVTQDELNKCVQETENVVLTIQNIIEDAKLKIRLKMED